MMAAYDQWKKLFNSQDDAFGEQVDYAQLVKYYSNDPEGEKRYSPAVCTSCKKEGLSW